MMAGESNTMFIDFAHLMGSNNLLNIAIADEYLRSCFAFHFQFFTYCITHGLRDYPVIRLSSSLNRQV